MFETETAVHFLLCCHGYTNIRITLTNDLHQINKKITLTGDNILKIRLFDYPKYGNEKIKKLQQFQLVIFWNLWDLNFHSGLNITLQLLSCKLHGNNDILLLHYVNTEL